MACNKCDHRGYIESSFLKDAKEYSSISVCKYCNDVQAYSDEIKSRFTEIPKNSDEDYSDYIKSKYGNKVETKQEVVESHGVVLPFQRKK
jgi:hypothetical protein